MEVYLEVTYMINAFLVLLSFELLCFLLNIQMNKKQLLTYVLTYNISCIFLYIDFFDGFLFLYDLFLTFFYFRKQVYIYYPIYLFIYVSLLSFLEYVLPHTAIFQGILIVEGMNFHSLFVLGILSVIIIYFYVSFCSYRIHEQDMIQVSFSGIHCMGLIDNGNKVFYKGYPVVFISESLLKDYESIDCIHIETAIGKEKIDIIVIDEMDVNYQTLHHVYVGVMKTSEYDCILNSQLMGGLL